MIVSSFLSVSTKNLKIIKPTIISKHLFPPKKPDSTEEYLKKMWVKIHLGPLNCQWPNN